MPIDPALSLILVNSEMRFSSSSLANGDAAAGSSKSVPSSPQKPLPPVTGSAENLVGRVSAGFENQ